MRAIGLLLGVTITLASCGGSVAGESGAPPDTSPARTGTKPASAGRAEIYAAVVRELVTKDHTFGNGPSPFKRVFIVDGTVKGAGDAQAGLHAAPRPFPVEVKTGITRALPELPSIRFVANPDSVIVERRACPRVRGDGVLISLGPIEHRAGPKVRVPSGMFFSCLGGQWLTYVLEPRGGSWRVLGTRGPISIS